MLQKGSPVKFSLSPLPPRTGAPSFEKHRKVKNMCDEQMTEKEKSYESVRLMEIDLESAKKAWLVKYGWQERCDFPDSCWRWCKEVPAQGDHPKQMMMCDLEEAIHIESYLE